MSRWGRPSLADRQRSTGSDGPPCRPGRDPRRPARRSCFVDRAARLVKLGSGPTTRTTRSLREPDRRRGLRPRRGTARHRDTLNQAVSGAPELGGFLSPLCFLFYFFQGLFPFPQPAMGMGNGPTHSLWPPKPTASPPHPFRTDSGPSRQRTPTLASGS